MMSPREQATWPLVSGRDSALRFPRFRRTSTFSTKRADFSSGSADFSKSLGTPRQDFQPSAKSAQPFPATTRIWNLAEPQGVAIAFQVDRGTATLEPRMSVSPASDSTLRLVRGNEAEELLLREFSNREDDFNEAVGRRGHHAGDVPYCAVRT